MNRFAYDSEMYAFCYTPEDDQYWVTTRENADKRAKLVVKYEHPENVPDEFKIECIRLLQFDGDEVYKVYANHVRMIAVNKLEFPPILSEHH